MEWEKIDQETLDKARDQADVLIETIQQLQIQTSNSVERNHFANLQQEAERIEQELMRIAVAKARAEREQQ